ncbi:hypothetical protein BGX23_007931 [Mortierella sp. AD031]|nr:hypothetical protein BGX23_007931 [Mortierella sp. AD031]
MGSAVYRFISTPELVYMVLSDLALDYLSRLSRTCSQLNIFQNPSLYRQVFLNFNDLTSSSYSSNNVPISANKNALRRLGMNVEHARRLSATSKGLALNVNCVLRHVRKVLPSNTDLMTVPPWLPKKDPPISAMVPIPSITTLIVLDIDITVTDADIYQNDRTIPSSRNPPAYLGQLAWILQQNPNLANVRLTELQVRTPHDTRFLLAALLELVQLHHLFVARVRIGSENDENRQFWKEIPHESSLTKNGAGEQAVVRRQEPLRHLARFSMHPMAQMTVEEINSHFEHYPRLEVLECPELGDHVLIDVVAHMWRITVPA